MGDIKRIHIFGASGSGTTTLGRALAEQLGSIHLDTDDYFWVKTDPPFQRIRPLDVRVSMLGEALQATQWVLSGSVCDWGSHFSSQFDLAIFLSVPNDVRIERLRKRELERYGRLLEEDEEFKKQNREFMDWAGRYETGGMDVRSRVVHEAWISILPCPVLRLDGLESVEERLSRIESFIHDGPLIFG